MHLSSARFRAAVQVPPPRCLILDQIELPSFYYTGNKSHGRGSPWVLQPRLKTEGEEGGEFTRTLCYALWISRHFHRAVLCIISRELDPLQWFTLGTEIKLTLAIILPSVKISYLLFSKNIYIYIYEIFLG